MNARPTEYGELAARHRPRASSFTPPLPLLCLPEPIDFTQKSGRVSLSLRKGSRERKVHYLPKIGLGAFRLCKGSNKLDASYSVSRSRSWRRDSNERSLSTKFG